MSVMARSALCAALAISAGAVLATPAGADSPGQSTGTPIPADVIAASAAPGSTWTPEAATYSVGKTADDHITMSDGTVLSADVYFPADASGKQAAGKFPVILTLTPYGKGMAGSAPGGTAGSQTGPSSFMVQRGFIDVVADVRGTGDSQGYFSLFDPAQDGDGVALVNWAAKLPGSNGKVGLYGASYLGIDQLLTAGSMPRNSPLKAIFPVVPGNDLYKDTATMGGLIDAEFDAAYLSLTGGLNAAGPLLEGMQNPSVLLSNMSSVELQHLQDLGSYDATFAANTLSGGADAYDDAYWAVRNPVNYLRKVVANNIPAYLVGGEFDLFQRGEPLDFSGLQNAWAGRPVTAPMLPNQATTGRYQLLDGPFTHLSGATAALEPLMLEWFDTWLRGENTGMDRTPTPLHYFDLGTGSYTEQAHYPFSNAKPTRFYFNPASSGSNPLSLADHSLSTAKPTSTASDTLLWSPLANPCGRATDQWSMGALSLATNFVAPQTPCVDNDQLGALGPDRASYTTPALTAKKTIAGPIDVTVYASATSKDTEWVAQVEDVAPDGTSTPLTEGALLGSLRATTNAGTWKGADGQILLPGHTYSAATAAPVVPGQTTRYDVEVFPTYATIAAGHRIRITLSTNDTPHLMPTLTALGNLVGGVYTVQMAPTAPSAVEIPLQ
jgi:putative CocE/NonD family hydrolase